MSKVTKVNVLRLTDLEVATLIEALDRAKGGPGEEARRRATEALILKILDQSSRGRR